MNGEVKDRIIDEIIERLKKENSIKKVVLFGSRARGDNKERSDYDIAVYGNIPHDVQLGLQHYCSEEIRTLHKIDLVFIRDKTYSKLIKNIEKEGIVLYEQNGR